MNTKFKKILKNLKMKDKIFQLRTSSLDTARIVWNCRFAITEDRLMNAGNKRYTRRERERGGSSL